MSYFRYFLGNIHAVGMFRLIVMVLVACAYLFVLALTSCNSPVLHAQSLPHSLYTRGAADESVYENAVTETFIFQPEFDVLWGVKIPMRDGTTLSATVVKPKGQKESLPVIFTFTPYIADTYWSRAAFFAKNGYVFALVDVRGRGNSGGAFEPFVNEGRDGAEVVAWFATQSWSNGKVAMWGGSYAGWNQWSTLKELPKALQTIVPAASCYPSIDFPMFKNIFGAYDVQWLTFISGVTSNGNLFNSDEYWNGKFRDRFMTHIPFRKLDSLAGNPSAAFQKWLKHPTPDAYWDAMSPTSEQYKRMSAPILTITGQYDGDQIGAMEYYRLHLKHASAEARKKHFLIIGPWDHAGTRSPRQTVGGVDFGAASVLDLNTLHKEWYDWTMKSGSVPSFLKKRIAYYMVAAKPSESKWKYADSVEAIASERRMLYLCSNAPSYVMDVERGKPADSLETIASARRVQPLGSSNAGDVFRSGKLSTKKSSEETPDQYIYNPLDITSAEREMNASPDYLADQSLPMSVSGNGLIYHSEPFPTPTEITGNVKLTVWMAIDAPDTDFFAALYEVMPDGRSVLLTTDQLRARYRESLRESKPVKQREALRYDFDKFSFFSRLVQKGSRLRLLITSPNTMLQQKNYNSGGEVSDETSRDARTTFVRVFHDAERASALELPIVKQ